VHSCRALCDSGSRQCSFPPHPFVTELCLWRGEDVCPGSLPGEVGAGHLIPIAFGFYRGFNATLCVQSIEPWLVFVCQRC